MKELDKKVRIGCIAFPLIIIMVITIHIYRALLVTGLLAESTCKSVELNYEEVRQTLYITAYDYGLGGQHCRSIISAFDLCVDRSKFDRQRDIILESVNKLYYKKQGADTLLIVKPSSYQTKEIKQLGPITVVMQNVDDNSKIRLCEADYITFSLYD